MAYVVLRSPWFCLCAVTIFPLVLLFSCLCVHRFVVQLLHGIGLVWSGLVCFDLAPRRVPGIGS